HGFLTNCSMNHIGLRVSRGTACPKVAFTPGVGSLSDPSLTGQYMSLGQNDAPEHHEGLLATELAGPRQQRLALVVIIVSVLAFAAAVPFAQVPLIPVQAFIPAYEAALVVIDL